jgi:hypothetical protein
MVKCSTHKKVYYSEAQAEEALLQAHINFSFRDKDGPVTYYKCEDCGYFHLTSKGIMNETLKRSLKDGKINKAKEVEGWERKLKNR